MADVRASAYFSCDTMGMEAFLYGGRSDERACALIHFHGSDYSDTIAAAERGEGHQDQAVN